MTNGIVASATPPPPQFTEFRQTENLQEALSYRAESTEVSYTDPDGRSFNLSLRTESVSYSMTYDRTAQVRGGVAEEAGRHDHDHGEHRVARNGHHGRHRGAHRAIRDELKELREDLRDLEKAFKESGVEVKDFKKQLHRMLKAVDHGYRERFRHRDPVEEEFAAVEKVHVEATAVEQKMTLAMDDVDPVYWNVENTAQRLVEFATGLFQGGDREEHVDKMVEGMKRGYAEAAQAFGGALPEVTEDTLELAVEMLEEWAEDGAPKQEEFLDLVA